MTEKPFTAHDARRKVESKQKLKMRTERLLRLIELDAPKPILAGGVLMLLKGMLLLDHEAMSSELGRWMAQSARVSSGYCSELDCNETIDVAETQPPICEEHAEEMKKLAEEGDEFESEDEAD